MASSGLACPPEFPAAAGVITTAITAELGARATVDDLAGVAPRLLLGASSACRGKDPCSRVWDVGGPDDLIAAKARSTTHCSCGLGALSLL